MSKSVYELIYAKLEKLGLDLQRDAPGAKVSKADGFMDLHFDYLGIRETFDGTFCYDISLAHNYLLNGDVMADPDMEIRVFPAFKMAEALAFQQAVPPVYQQVYPARDKVCLQIKHGLNKFLNQWLKNCIDQGHRFNR